MATYETYQQKAASHKVTLAKIKAAKRLIAWSVHSGSVYKKETFDFSVIDSITENGTAMTEVTSLSLVTTNTWFNDRDNKIIYLRSSDSTNPNGKFLSMKFWNFYASTPVNAPYNLSSGKDVYWQPLIRQTSLYGVELDNTEQIGFALEGSGSINLQNDRDYWDSRYEGYVFEQQPVLIYSWFKNTPITEAKLIFKGYVNAKTFGQDVSFKLKDTLSQLRSEFPLSNISDVSGALAPEALLNAKQRRIYGKVYGYRPTNIDQEVDGYTLSGTVSVSVASDVVTGSGTSFLSHFSPDDEIVIAGENYTVKSVSSNTSLTVTDNFEASNSGLSYKILSNMPKAFMNRVWLVAGHQCCQPTTTISSVFSLNKIFLTDHTDFDEGDEIYVDASGGEVVTIERISTDGMITLAQNLVVTPSAGTTVTRFCAQNVRINNKKLQYSRDYTISFSGGITKIILDEEAEKNINPIRGVIGSSVVFTNSSRSVTGTGTFFTSQLRPNQWIRSQGQFDFFQILSIESDTSLTLRSAATYSETDTAQYIADAAFEEGVDVLSCEIIGTTSNGTSAGILLRTASDIVGHVLDTSSISNKNAASFVKSKAMQPAYLGMAIPDVFSSTRPTIVRDIINKINQSVFGSLVQNKDFEIEYNILQPKKPSGYLTLRQHDILDIQIESNNDRVVKTAQVNYKSQEYSAESGIPSISSYSKTSSVGSWLVSSTNTKVVDTLLHRQKDARLHANRWAFLLELATNTIRLKTKMIASRLQVNDVVYIEHDKLFERTGGGKRKFAAVQSIKKSGTNVEIELDDLANAFNRVGVICDTGSPAFSVSSNAEKAAQGYITDQYGLIDSDETTYGLNTIW